MSLQDVEQTLISGSHAHAPHSTNNASSQVSGRGADRIERTGTLKEIPVSGQSSSTSPQASVDDEDDEDYPLAEEIFAATTLLVPMSFLLLMMYMWVPASTRSRAMS